MSTRRRVVTALAAGLLAAVGLGLVSIAGAASDHGDHGCSASRCSRSVDAPGK